MWPGDTIALCRHFRPAPYQVLQEVMLREQRGEAVDTEAALQPESIKPARSRMDLANRLRMRKERQRQGHTLYSGFVPPYNTQSRVFDANELRRAATQVRVYVCERLCGPGGSSCPLLSQPAGCGQCCMLISTMSLRSQLPDVCLHICCLASPHLPRPPCPVQVGYSISPSGDMPVPAQAAPSGPTPHGAGVVNTIMSLTRRHSSISAVGSTTGALPPAWHTSGSGAVAAAGSIDGIAAGHHLASGFIGDGGSSVAGTSTPAAGSVVGQHEALPPVEGFVPNPVLANLERAFNSDPRRHRRNDSQASQTSLISSISKWVVLAIEQTQLNRPPCMLQTVPKCCCLCCGWWC